MLPRWNLAEIRARMFNQPLLVTQDRALAALGVMGPKLDVRALLTGEGTALSIDQLKAKAAAAKAEHDDLPGDGDLKKYVYIGDGMYAETDPYEIWNGVAIFEVRGTLMSENGIDPYSGATGYDGLSRKARHALANPAVKGAILDIDSGGGDVTGLGEAAAHMLAFAAAKPLRAVIRGCGCSAAYYLAACAGPGNITSAPYSIVGSIGAIMLHADFSKQLEDEGIDVTMITSAPHKADASSLKPLEAGVHQRLKAMVDQCAASFIDHVASARGADREAIVAQEARFYSGQDALELGLVDKFMPWDESMKEFAAQLNGSGSHRTATAPSGASSSKGSNMSTENNGPAAEQQPVFTQAEHDQALATARAEGVTAGATAERERITALAEIGGATLPDAVSAAIAEGTEPGAFAVAQAKAGREKAAGAAAAAKGEAISSADLPEGSRAAADPAAPKVNRGQAAVERNRGKVPGLPAQG